MSVANAYAPAVSGPSEARIAFLRKVGLLTFGGLSLTAVVAVVSMFTIAPIIMRVPFGAFAASSARSSSPTTSAASSSTATARCSALRCPPSLKASHLAFCC